MPTNSSEDIGLLVRSSSQLGNGRSRVTNGRALFAGKVDGRSAEARRMRDLILEFAEPFGGMDRAPEAIQQVIRRAAAIAVAAEQAEGALARGEEIDPYMLAQLAATFANLTERLDPQWRRTVRQAQVA